MKLDRNTGDFLTGKQEIKVLNKTIKKSIRTAKKNYYEAHFEEFKGDLKETWQSIGEILNKTIKKKKIPEYFLNDGIKIEDKIAIANLFNQFM